MPLAPGESPEDLSLTLQCLQRQTLQADELVIAADGPLPARLEGVINSCPLPWRLHGRDRPGGIGAALAVVAPRCGGDIIVRIDSDDLYAPEHTATVVHALERDPRLGMVGSQLLELDTDHGGRLSARNTPTDPATALSWLPWRNPLNHQTVALRKQALLQAGGYRHTPAFEDWDLWLRITAAGYGLMSVPAYTAAARVNERHRRRRHGLRYIRNEVLFYGRQLREGRMPVAVAVIACLSRIPWRVLPIPLLRWWMGSRMRGSPAIDAAWVTELLADPSR